MTNEEFVVVPGFYPLSMTRSGLFENAISKLQYNPTRTVTKSGRVQWFVTLRTVGEGGVKKTSSVTVQRAWALCFLPTPSEHKNWKVVMRDNPVNYKDVVDPANIVWIRTYCGTEVNTVLDDGTEIMALSKTSFTVGVATSTLRDHLFSKGFSTAGTHPVYLI